MPTVLELVMFVVLVVVLLGILYLLWAGFEKLRKALRKPVPKELEKYPVTGYARLPEKFRLPEPLYDGVPFDKLPDEISSEKFKTERTAEVKKALGPRYHKLLESEAKPTVPQPKQKKAVRKSKKSRSK